MRRTHRLVLLAVTAAGLALRVWNAEVAHVHEDERHYASDGAWALHLPASEWLPFLYDHPHPHLRLPPNSGEIAQWGTPGTIRHLGHPALFATLLGPLFAWTESHSLSRQVLAARLANAAIDTAVIPTVAVAAAALGLSPWAAVFAAALYAFYPPAVTFGSLAYPEALLALGVATLLAVTAKATLKRAVLAGAVAGLMVATKATGLLAPAWTAVLLLRRPWNGRAVLLALAASAVVAMLFVHPLRYAQEVIDPLDKSTAVGPNLLANLRQSVGYTLDVQHYYWLGFAQHGRPLALPMARPNRMLTPVYLAALGIAVAAGLAARRRRLVALCALPIVAVLAIAPVFNGMWRVHLCTPLMVVLIASALGDATPRQRMAAAIAAAALAMLPLLPLRPDADGHVALEEVLFANGSEGQGHNLFNPMKMRMFFAEVSSGHPLSRQLWLAPGNWRVKAAVEGPLRVRIDGLPVPLGNHADGRVVLQGFLHTLDLDCESRAKVFDLSITRP